MGEKMKILSLFDGCGMAYQALKNIGIAVDKYYAFEIDKYATMIASKNHPDIIQMGDIANANPEMFTAIDLLVAGFPCQSFSIAGNRLAFDDDRGKLFFTALNLLKTIKPKHFIFENVASMKKEIREEISKLIGVEPIMINSALVSAQQRKRWYWTNIDVKQPDDKKIYLKDIIEYGFIDRDKSFCLDANYYKGISLDNYFKKHRRQVVFDRPIRIFSFNSGGQSSRVYSLDGKSVSISANGGGMGAKTGLYLIPNENEEYIIRKLTPIECERLQTLPDNYTAGVSPTRRYTMLGNGFTVAVIAHILKTIR